MYRCCTRPCIRTSRCNCANMLRMCKGYFSTTFSATGEPVFLQISLRTTAKAPSPNKKPSASNLSRSCGGRSGGGFVRLIEIGAGLGLAPSLACLWTLLAAGCISWCCIWCCCCATSVKLLDFIGRPFIPRVALWCIGDWGEKSRCGGRGEDAWACLCQAGDQLCCCCCCCGGCCGVCCGDAFGCCGGAACACGTRTLGGETPPGCCNCGGVDCGCCGGGGGGGGGNGACGGCGTGGTR
mmetsp:Transcript_99661/g.287699  ORF Transcript_99661/g.287699 Transcript_99661/m.287699 type:complete len:239 (-) Transcript_99661:152-868(-)